MKYHHAPDETAPELLALSSSVPQDGWVRSPSPRNDSVDSDRIAIAMISIVLAKISGSTLGRICLRTIHHSDAPSALDRSTNCRSLTDSTCDSDDPRRAGPAGHPDHDDHDRDLAERQVLGARPEQRDHDDRKRQERDHQEPVVERRETVIDRSAEVARRRFRRRRRSAPTTAAAATPTISDTRVPRISSESMSRPFSSVPSQCAELGACRMADE